MNVLIVGAASFLGAMAVALLGWLQQDPAVPFEVRKFAGSIIRGLVAAVGIAAVFNYAGATPPIMYLIAFLGGAGIDAGGSRIAGSIPGIKAK